MCKSRDPFFYFKPGFAIYIQALSLELAALAINKTKDTVESKE